MSKRPGTKIRRERPLDNAAIKGGSRPNAQKLMNYPKSDERPIFLKPKTHLCILLRQKRGKKRFKSFRAPDLRPILVDPGAKPVSSRFCHFIPRRSLRS